MSMEAANKFLQRLEKETTLRGQLYISSPKTFDELLTFAQSKGFVVEADELKTAIDGYKSQLKGGGNMDAIKRLVSSS